MNTKNNQERQKAEEVGSTGQNIEARKRLYEENGRNVEKRQKPRIKQKIPKITGIDEKGKQ